MKNRMFARSWSLTASLVIWSISASVSAGDIVLDSDLEIRISAVPNLGIIPMNAVPIAITMSATNHGPNMIDSTIIVDTNDILGLTIPLEAPENCDIAISMEDADGESRGYILSWDIHHIAAGQTQNCTFRTLMYLNAPYRTRVTIALSGLFSDPDPSNDRASIDLLRGDLPPESIPAGSLLSWLLIAFGVVGFSLMRLRHAEP